MLQNTLRQQLDTSAPQPQVNPVISTQVMSCLLRCWSVWHVQETELEDLRLPVMTTYAMPHEGYRR